MPNPPTRKDLRGRVEAAGQVEGMGDPKPGCQQGAETLNFAAYKSGACWASCSGTLTTCPPKPRNEATAFHSSGFAVSAP